MHASRTWNEGTHFNKETSIKLKKDKQTLSWTKWYEMWHADARNKITFGDKTKMNCMLCKGQQESEMTHVTSGKH